MRWATRSDYGVEGMRARRRIFGFGAAALITAAGASAALAQARDDRYPASQVVTGSVPGQPQPWSGEPGASGHPLMQPGAILAAVSDFKNCIERTWPEAARRNISRASFDRFTAGLEPDLRIMDLMDAQPEFTKPFWDYVDALVNDERIARGREILAKYEPTFAAVEK